MTQTFDDVVITGSPDKIQLTVQATSNQDEPLQSWQALSGDELARIQPDGRFQLGSLAEAGATGDSQIEVFRHEDATALPKRGLNITGAINDALNAVVSWSVHELFLRGTAGVKALHSALRVRLVNQTTGATNTNGELRAGEFEVSNNGGATSERVPVATGVDVRLTNEASGYIDSGYGVRVEVEDLNTNGISNAYALHATGAKTRLDDVLELHGNRAIAPSAESETAKIYVKSDGKLYARLDSGIEYLLSSAPTPVSPDDDGKFLRSDSTWHEVTENGANNELSNLASTNINADLIPAPGSSAKLGSASNPWNPSYIYGVSLGAGPINAPQPPSGYLTIFARDNGHLYYRNSSGELHGPFANTSLSNLGVVAVSTSLISNTDNTIDLGSSVKKWRAVYSNALYLEERSAPSTPSLGDGTLYLKSDGLYFKGADGIEIGPLVGRNSGGDPRLKATVTTTDAGVTNFFSTAELTSTSAISIDGIVLFHRPTLSEVGGICRFAVTFARGTGGEGIVGQFINQDTNGNPPGVTVDYNTTTHKGRLRVQGKSGQTWKWEAYYFEHKID